ncbi:MAG: hypothetical protein HKN47_12525 [Pirellulaceae bacterium]|nr:hypothetical protein [Pirellulaceae bacterium]
MIASIKQFDDDSADNSTTLSPAASDPTPTEIERRARAIRKRWSESVTSRRRVGSTPKWSLPTVRITEIDSPES